MRARLRILIATHAPLNAKYGAAQVALSLGDALRRQGAQVDVWSPQPIPASVRAYGHFRYMRQALRAHLASSGPYDVLDAPAFFLQSGLDPVMLCVARSVQPDLRYIWCDIEGEYRAGKLTPKGIVDAISSLLACGRLLYGWARADAILCLGTDELGWMRRRFPWWRNKLWHYLLAPQYEDRAALLKLRMDRKPSSGRRYLWIGRWTYHKGIRDLLGFIERMEGQDAGSVLTLAGCGSEPLRDVAPAMVASGRVRIVPEFDRQQLMGLLRDHDAGLFTSIAEGWGLSLHEMLEAGMTVHATRAGAVADLAPYFAGQLRPFPPREPGEAVPPAMPAGYFDLFGWEGIAQKYLALAASWLEGRAK